MGSIRQALNMKEIIHNEDEGYHSHDKKIRSCEHGETEQNEQILF